MSDFLGTKLTNHDVNEVRREFRRKRKYNHCDEYDFYVYYKNLLAEERKKREKRERSKRRKEKEQAEGEDQFKPSNYISSRYKRNEHVTKKGIYDYIDEEDSIYEDIITRAHFDDKANYADDLQFSFFNESVSYALLRNNNYIDGIPIGIDMKLENKYIKEDVSNVSRVNDVDKHDCATSIGPSTYVTFPLRTLSSLDEKPKPQVQKNGRKESRKDDVFEGNSPQRRKQMGPKLPTIFEEIRQKIGEQTNIRERNENEYINILSSRNRLISIKMEEQKTFEKLIKEIYKPKNNFEGVFYKKKENSIDQMKKREFNRLRKDFLLPHRKAIHDEGSIEARTQIEITTTGKKQTLGQMDYEDYSDSSLENAYTSSARRNTNKGYYAMVLDRKNRQSQESCIIPYNTFSMDDSGEEDVFLLYNPSQNQAEEVVLRRCKFYRTLFRSRDVERPDSRAITDEIEDLNMRYEKLINPNVETKLSKSELLELYAPKKSWVQSGSSLTHDGKETENEIYVLKNKINFNNDLKKKYRFYFYCRMKEGKMNMDGSLSRCVNNILNAAERAEFEELMGKLKVYYLDFYNREIANEDVSTNFQIQEYEFAKGLCEKLGISDPSSGDQSGAQKKERSILDDFLKIPQFVFDAIFCA
ncbi:conserved Plasmodium protein, unknown function [Plasmodium knowlesi strain H]|uniref:Uncharacterized protein n=3 Tax=Plasmodium knowlesi TaxID=5850 RepID=A0A5K1U0M9_PLAKH|nr:conserved Plasmodium protein, unknown function [Plasmodium knowlesi strain H]OTN66336.1 Uncharacterized protein PKNOH_S09533400 [Plasmodium knowlesi]CAA9989973.1 conserved Plasmodium protein, unknown function [Plasmodium knowlesi strain H]SBO24560.1 conserved Plasmodium protein, unknown function [Plasmodium knowlesi strain H]SBO26336.1 conserved Plasmodium protein, unknown function [Plasmodium knowlesi strain H]VVS79447.1 conserved Plasmodium protein, unknown function [Plasmodium knowlesi s|eukprot:XP_002259988.1 hypothetical protein, conserved in Plasmodium species [Plasmodium knowlesi strain H]